MPSLKRSTTTRRKSLNPERPVQVRVTVRQGSWERRIPACLPRGTCRPADVVPALHEISDAASAVPEPITCGPGCGACCRQLVPVTGPEIGFLQRVIDRLPISERRSVQRAQREALTTFHRKVFEPADGLARMPREDLRRLGARWFALGIPCPFLIDESCSIYEWRPLICREYLVTSPRSACATPGRGLISRRMPPVSIWSRVIRNQTHTPAWLPLAHALDAPPLQTPAGTGPEILARLLSAKAGTVSNPTIEADQAACATGEDLEPRGPGREWSPALDSPE